MKEAEKLFQRLGLGRLVVDLRGKIVDMNEVARNAFFRVEEPQNRLIQVVCPELSLKQWRQLYDELVVEDEMTVDLEYIDAAGDYFSARSYLVRKATGGLVEIIFNRLGSDSDQLKEIVRTSIDQIDEMIFWIRADGTIAYLNTTAVRQLEYSTEEDLHDSHFGQIDPSLDSQSYSELYQKVRRHKYVERESIFRTSKKRPVEVKIACTYVEYRELSFNCIIAKDISHEKKIKRQLEEFKFALENTRLMCLWNDLKGHIVYANAAACEVYGYRLEEFTKLHISDLNKSMNKERLKEKVREIGASEDWTMETEHTTRDGRILPVEVSATRMSTDFRELNVLFIRDITSRMAQVAKDKDMMDKVSRLRDRLQEENEYLHNEITDRNSFENIISVSENYKKVLNQVQKVAETDSTVLITGETGTGKELLARAIHRISRRSDRSLIRVNCANLPRDLIESELFGHKKGAFTGAFQDKKGRFELANDGTIFLDEIGELPLELQPKLLRVLQEGEFERLGDSETIKVDVRIIAATNRNLKREIRRNRFRQDLYYRLNVFPIHNIALRERPKDIPVLVQHFVEKYCRKAGKKTLKISKGTINQLMKYGFPGNIRELENIVERAVILSPGVTLRLDWKVLHDPVEDDEPDFLQFEEMQRQHILEALDRCRWKVTGPGSASELLGLNGKTLASKMRKLNIQRSLND